MNRTARILPPAPQVQTTAPSGASLAGTECLRFPLALLWLCLAAALLPLCAQPAVAGEEAPELTSARTLGKAFTAAARKVRPAVVSIRTETPVNLRDAQYADPFDLFNDEFAQRFFRNRRPARQQMAEGLGSGFLISADGYLLTNTHVINGAVRITVRLADGQEFSGKVVGADAKSDVSLLKIDAAGLPFLNFGNSAQVEVGEWVLAVGSPFGLTQTVTSGIVSATGRNSMGILDYEDFIQTDAAINPGNSGGPLINLSGEVIGLNTAIFSKSGGYMGIGFSIPANAVQHICRQLRQKGHFAAGYLGADVRDLTAAEKGFTKITAGAFIERVPARSPAAAAGLRMGDIIVALNGQPVADAASFQSSAALLGAGETASLRVRREGGQQERELQVRLTDSESAGADTEVEELGIWVRTLNTQEQKQLGNPALFGSLVSRVAPGGVAARLGMNAGTIILKINGQDATTPEKLRAALKTALRQNNMELLLIKEGVLQTLLLRLR